MHRRSSRSAGDARVLDLAAGTGRLTHELALRFAHVVAVEPNDAMRALIADGEVLAGTAEAIPLDDASVDAVFVGEAFHWFDTSRGDRRDRARAASARRARDRPHALVGDGAAAARRGAGAAARAVGALRAAAQPTVGRRVRRVAVRAAAVRAVRGGDRPSSRTSCSSCTRRRARSPRSSRASARSSSRGFARSSPARTGCR